MEEVDELVSCFETNINMRALNLTFLNYNRINTIYNSVGVFPKRSLTDDNSVNIVKSSSSDVEIPNTTIPELIFSNFAKFPHKVAVECVSTGKKYTYEDIRVKSQNLNRGLRKQLKLQKGDVVALLLPNIPEYGICILGALEAGLIITTINPLYTAEEIKRQLIDVNAKIAITLSTLWTTLQAALQTIPQNIPVFTIKSTESDISPQGAINFNEFTNTNFDFNEVTPGDVNDVVLMPYSSGTTGLPKGVQHTHRSVISLCVMLEHPDFRMTETTTENHQDVVPAILPFFHIYGLQVILINHLHQLCKLVTVPRFTPELFVKTFQNHEPTILYAVPPMVMFMTNHPSVKKEYLQSLRYVLSAAAPLGVRDEKALIKKAARNISIVQGYGLTECAAATLATKNKETKLVEIRGSVGKVLPSTMLKVVPVDNPFGEPIGPNLPGELLIKGPQVMKGYHNKTQETSDVFIDGWLRTGDLGYYDHNNMLYITDRLKELIKVKGYQVAPAELEEIIRSYPDVDEAAVIGIPHDTYGEVPKAFVVPKANITINIKKLKEYVNENVAAFKQVKGGFVIIDKIPKSATGKILRRQLK